MRKQADAGVDIVNDGEMSKPSYATYIKDRLSGLRRRRQHVRLPGSGRRSRISPSACSATPALAAKDAGVQRADQRARPGAAEADVDHLKAAFAKVEGGGDVHRGGLAGRRVALLPQRALSKRGSLPVRDRGCHAARVRDDRPRGDRAADRLPRSRHGPAHPARRLKPRRVAQEGAAPCRSAQPRRRQHSVRADAACTCAGATTRGRITATCRLPT